MSLTMQLALACAFVAAVGYGVLAFLVGRFDREFSPSASQKTSAENR